MHVQDNSRTEKLSRYSNVSTFRRGGIEELGVVDIPSEHVVNVTVNDQPTMVLTCTPDSIIELVIGRLFTEGLIDGTEDVESISLCEFSEHADVKLKNGDVPIRPRLVDEVATCCTDTKTIANVGRRARPLEHFDEVVFDADQIFRMADVFANDTPLHKSTYGVHSCSIFKDGEMLYSYEDLGRHNAFDKAVGAALLDKAELGSMVVYSSGRIPVDMVTKAIRSKIPVLVTKATPTTRSVDIARQYGLVLIGRARPDSFCVFSE